MILEIGGGVFMDEFVEVVYVEKFGGEVVVVCCDGVVVDEVVYGSGVGFGVF